MRYTALDVAFRYADKIKKNMHMWAAVCMCVQCMMYLCLALCVCGALFFVSLYLSLSVYSTDILQSLIGIVLNRK